MSLIGGFQPLAFQPIPAFQQAGIGLAPVARPIDFVIQSPLWRQGFVSPVQKAHSEEMTEMMRLYKMWKGH